MLPPRLQPDSNVRTWTVALLAAGIAVASTACPGRGLYVRPRPARARPPRGSTGATVGAVAGASPLSRIHAIYRMARLAGYQEVGAPETDNLKDGTQVQTVLLRRIRWRLRAVPQSVQLAMRRRAELMRLPPAERARRMDRLVDHAQIWWIEGDEARRASPRQITQFRPATRSHRHYREVAYLGHEGNTAWFVYAPIPTWVTWQRRLHLHPGSLPAPALVRGLAVKDPASWTAFQCFDLLGDLGPKAIPAVRNAIARRLPQRGSAIRAIGRARGDPIGSFLTSLVASRDKTVAGAARRALLDVPRKEATKYYLSWLAADAGKRPVLPLLRAIQALQIQRAVPLLQKVLARPESISEYLLAFHLSRAFLGPEIPSTIQTEAMTIRRAGYATATRAPDEPAIDAAVARLLGAGDPEAIAMAGLGLSLYISKGDTRAVQRAGRTVLQRAPQGAGLKLVTHLAATLFGTDLLKIQKLATILRGLRPTR